MLLALLVAAVGVVVGAAVVLLGGVAAGRDGSPGEGPPGPGSAPAGLGVAVAVAVVAAAVVVVGAAALVGLRGGGAAAPGDRPPPAARRPPAVPAAPEPRPAPPRPRGPAAVVAGPEVHVVATPPGRFPPNPPAVDRLPPAAVLSVTASGFAPDTDGAVAQCRAAGDPCRASFPVRFDGSGTARFQFLVTSRDPAGRVHCAPASCRLVVRGPGDRVGTAATVFGGAALPRPRAVVTPGPGVHDGQRVRVSASGFPPGARLEAALCGPPGLPPAEWCGRPALVLTAGPDGAAAGRFIVRSGPVGSRRHPCRRASPCGLAVVAPAHFTGAPVQPVAFSAGRGAGYYPARVAAGLALAAALLVLAWWLVRTTDWSEPSEAATPEMDRATLG